MVYDGQAFSNISADTAVFQLVGGYYGMDVIATFGGGNVDLKKLAGDNSTFVSVLPQTFTVAGSNVYLLAPGRYKVAVTTATGVYVQLSRAPV